MTQEKAAQYRAAEDRRIGELLFVRVFDRVLHIACDVVRCALGLIQLAFGLQLLVVGPFASSVLYGALGIVDSAFHVLLIHVASPGVITSGYNARPSPSFHAN